MLNKTKEQFKTTGYQFSAEIEFIQVSQFKWMQTGVLNI